MIIWQIIKIAIAVYVSFVVLLFCFQRNFIYFPDKSRPTPPQNADVINVRTKDGIDLQAWYFPPAKGNFPTIVYFHGNGGNIGLRYNKIKEYLSAGYGVLLAEYRGYGGNNGKPSEQGVYNDARAYFKWLSDNKISDYVIYGESLGTGVAIQMAMEYKPIGLILVTPYSSITDVAEEIYWYVPVKFLMHDHFDNISKIATLRMPLIFLHGQRDEVIAYKFSKKLFNVASGDKTFIDFPEGNHNNLYDYGAADYVIRFLEKLNK